jgi:dipeptidyl aminopeptidase/acylaminoacyl peptidase
MRQHALPITLLLALGCASALPPEPDVPEPARAPVAPAIVGERQQPPEASAGGEQTATLVLRGAPPIPAELRERLSRYLETRWAKLEALSDDGKRALVTTRFAQTPQAHLLAAPMGARQQLTFDGEPVTNLSFVPGGGQAFLFTRDRGGDEQFQIYRHQPGAETTLLTDGKSRHGPYVWSWDGSRIAYTSNARNGKDMDLYLGDGKSRAAGKLLLERSGHWYPIEFSRDGKRLLAAEYVSINDSRLYTIDLGSREAVRITPEQPVASYRAAAFDPTGTSIYTASDRDGEFVELLQLELATRSWKPLSRHIPWNVEELALSPDGTTLAFVTNEDGWGVLRLLDTRTGKERLAPNLPKGLVSGLRFAKQSGVLGFSLGGPGEPGDAYSYELRSGKLTRWTESEIGGLDRGRFVSPSLVHYDTFDGRKIPAFYYRPKSSAPHPVLIWIHGGPEAQSRPSFVPLLQYLAAESGIAVLVPNVRGSDGYGKSYLLLDNGKLREDSVRDIGSLLDWIAKQKELDSRRVAVLGGSYGGYMVLASLVHFGERLVAGVDVVGIGNFVTFLENTKDYRRDLRRAEYGDERDPEMREFLRRISPTSNADKIKSHLFVAHGANDPRVPLSETDQIVAAVEKQGRDVWYMVAKNEGHGFQKKDNRDTFTLLSALFLEKHLRQTR